MNKKVFAPYQRFKYQHMNFPLGFRYCNQADIMILKKVPLRMGKLKLSDGTVLNKPRKKKVKKQSKK